MQEMDVMSAMSLTHTRRELLATVTATGALSLLPKALRAAAGSDSIRPFMVSIPQGEIDELRRRIAATRWPSKELVNDRSQGVQLATIKELARY